MHTSTAIYKFNKVIKMLYGINIDVNFNGFLFFIHLGPKPTIKK